jgi:hypothetical protein
MDGASVIHTLEGRTLADLWSVARQS